MVVHHRPRHQRQGPRVRIPGHIFPLAGGGDPGNALPLCGQTTGLRPHRTHRPGRPLVAARPAHGPHRGRPGLRQRNRHRPAAAQLVAGAAERPIPRADCRRRLHPGPAVHPHPAGAAAGRQGPVAQRARASAGQLLLQRAPPRHPGPHRAAGPQPGGEGHGLAGPRGQRRADAPRGGGLGLDRHEPGRWHGAHRLPSAAGRWQHAVGGWLPAHSGGCAAGVPGKRGAL